MLPRYPRDAERGTAGTVTLRYTVDATGDSVTVVLLTGKPSRMVVHRPEHCYKSAGYDMSGPAVQVQPASRRQPSTP